MKITFSSIEVKDPFSLQWYQDEKIVVQSEEQLLRQAWEIIVCSVRVDIFLTVHLKIDLPYENMLLTLWIN
jgi:hypothetical protein